MMGWMMFNKYSFMDVNLKRNTLLQIKERKATQCDCGIMTFDKDGECALCKVEARFTALVLKGISMSRYPLLRTLARR